MEGADPRFPIPSTVRELPLRGGFLYEAAGGEVEEAEFAWMEARRPLCANGASLALDFGEEEGAEIVTAFRGAGLEGLLPTLHWPGVGTRWRGFLSWCQEQRRAGDTACPAAAPLTPAAALRGFGRSLGRVITYRALALDPEGLQRIQDADCIFPSGQLRVPAETLARIVDEKGVRKVCVARLYIAHLRALLGYDPSISLHDDWQTTSLIASGYATEDRVSSTPSTSSWGSTGWKARAGPSGGKRVYLFELSVPKVESIGWTLQDVAERRSAVLGGSKEHDPWFCFPAPAYPDGVWFDGRLQRTERYGLYGVPFLSRRLRRLLLFGSVEEVGAAIRPFAEAQAAQHAEDIWQEAP